MRKVVKHINGFEDLLDFEEHDFPEAIEELKLDGEFQEKIKVTFEVVKDEDGE